MFQLKRRYQPHSNDHRSRIFIRGRELATAKEFADYVREVEEVRISSMGL